MHVQRAGLGDLGDAQRNIAIGTQAASIATGALAGHLIPLAAAGPIGAAIAGVGIALALIFSRKGPAQKVATTHIVDEVEPQLRANRDAYLSGPRTLNDQQAALANFDYAWSQVMAACGQVSLGNPGRACIADRQRGGQWDWFSYYRDPIANDAPNPDAVESAFNNIGSAFSSGGSFLPLLLIGGLLYAAAEL